VNGLTGNLDADTGGAPLSVSRIAAANATVTTEDGSARLAFTSAPDNVLVSTGGGPAWLTFARAPGAVAVSTYDGSADVEVPGGQYTVTAESDGGPQQVSIASSPGAHHTISVNTGGGPLTIEPRG